MKALFALLLSLVFLFPTDVKSQEAALRKIATQAHPRLLLFKNETDLVKKAIAQGGALKEVNDLLQKEAVLISTLSMLEYQKIGRRLLSVSREAIRRIFYLSYAYRMTGDTKFLEAATQNLLTVSKFEDWNPTHFLDVAEMTLAVSIGYDWLYDALSTSEKETVRSAIIEKGLKPSLVKKYNSWLNNNNNWNQVCNAGLTYGAIAVYESEPDLAFSIISRAVSSIKIPMKEYGPDGAYPEGYGYWSYGTSFNLLFLDALEKLTGTDFGLISIPGFMKTAGYLENMVAPSGRPFNYSDSGPGAESNGAMFWFAKKLKQPSLLWNELQYIKNSPGFLTKERLLPLVLIWAKDLDLKKSIPPETTFWQGGGLNPVVLMRSSWTDPNALFLGFKLGSPSNNHAHMDAGSFIFEADGVRWAMELGMQNYESLESKGMNIWGKKQDAQRWTIFRYNNYSHNTLTFDDSLQRVGGNTVIDRQATSAPFSYAISDLSSVYKGQVKKAERGVALKNRSYAIIQDEIETGNNPVKMQWRMLTPATLKIISPTEVELSKDGKKLRLQINADQPLTIKTWSTAPANDYDASNPGTTIIGFETLIPAHQFRRFVVNLVPGQTKSEGDQIIPLKEWK